MARSPLSLRRVRVVALLAVSGVLVAGCGGGDSSPNAKAGGRTLATRSTEVDSVEVSVSPRAVSDRAAVFAIKLDTHTGDLNVDLKKAATLTVAGTDWPLVAYAGDGPGGHHREGTLRFRAGGTPDGAMRLVIGGLGKPAEFSWDLR